MDSGNLAYRAFAVVEDGLYYIGRGDDSMHSPLRFFQFSTGRNQELALLDHPGNLVLTVSPDRKTFLYNKVVSQDADLMLIENFR